MKRNLILITMILGMILVVGVSAASSDSGQAEASTLTEHIIAAPVGYAGDFGKAVALDGDWLVIGADYSDIDGEEIQGSVYVYERDGSQPSGWRYETELTASNGAEFDQFGISVAIDGTTIVVGAERADVGGSSSQGSAYVFEYQGGSWTETQILTEDLSALDYYGSAVAVDGDTMAVGARFEISGGKVFVYYRDGDGDWVHQRTLVDSISDSNANFGVSLALDGDVLVVGADFHDRSQGTLDNTGAVYVFGRNQPTPDNWGRITHFTAPANTLRLGHSVAIDGDTIVAGARTSRGGNGGSLSSVGEAFVYENAGRGAMSWTETQILTADDPAAYLYFGKSVAIAGDEILVGANGYNNDRGKVYQFSRNGGWSQTDTFTASDATSGDGFGSAVVMSAFEFVVGAPYGNASYIYPQAAPPPTAIALDQQAIVTHENMTIVWVLGFLLLTIICLVVQKRRS